jgi:alkylation response protein AidB-like acyl-CoA dehydrogenase
MGGISILLIEKSRPGVTTRQMLCSGVWPSGTTYITFEDVKVPVENLIGKENEGFKYVMDNLCVAMQTQITNIRSNHERWGICVQATAFSRVLFSEAFQYAHKRKTFGQRLVGAALFFSLS